MHVAPTVTTLLYVVKAVHEHCFTKLIIFLVVLGYNYGYNFKIFSIESSKDEISKTNFTFNVT